MERLTSGDVGNVHYTDITESELEAKQEAYRKQELRNRAMRAKYPHYVPGRHDVNHLNCAGCGLWFNLHPALCTDCLDRSLTPGAGPYRTPGMLATKYKGDPEICGGCGGMHPYPIDDDYACEGTLNAAQVRTRLSFHADVSLMNENRRLEDKLDFERWRFKRMASMALLFAATTLALAILLKMYGT